MNREISKNGEIEETKKHTSEDVMPVLEMIDITKIFPGIVANDKINLKIYPGEVHAIVGENGAGKSTLMSTLYGLHQPEEGNIKIRGTKTIIDSPSKAISEGIGMVFQHFMLVPNLSVIENIVLGIEQTKGMSLDLSEARAKVTEIAEKYNLLVDLDEKVENLTVGIQQRVEILKTLYRGSNILILDEPTAVLIPQEVEGLLRMMRVFVEEGKSIIFITHKLKEVLEVSDRISVLKQGKIVGNVLRNEANEAMLAKLMVGREVLLRIDKEKANPKEIVLNVENLSYRKNNEKKEIDNISFYVRSGEILGIAGVEGNGQSELVKILTGNIKGATGTINFKGNNLVNNNQKQIRGLKLGHIPEDRHREGLILDYSVKNNLLLGYQRQKPFSAFGLLDQKNINSFAKNESEKNDIRGAGIETTARSLSGGNQQKIVIARELYLNPDLLVASQPTRGVDVGAIEAIHREIIKLRDEGKAVIVVSSELSEVMSLSDKIAVMFEGEIVGIVDAETATEEMLGLMMAGIKPEEKALNKDTKEETTKAGISEGDR